MEADLLQQLRDIHLPPDPSWWPPAPGWWLLAALLLAALWHLLRLARQANARRRPIREARRLYDRLHADFQKGVLTAPAYLHESNELLKRLMIHGLGVQEARAANDADWLAILDAAAGTTDFTEGPGRQLGNQRFRVHPEADPEALHPVLARFFGGVRP